MNRFLPALFAFGIAAAGCAHGPSNSTEFRAVPQVSLGSSSGSFTTVHAFAGAPNDGDSPNTLIYAGGTFFGTTVNGGIYQNNATHKAGGTIFRLSPDGSESIVYNFGRGTRNDPPFYNSLVSVDGSIYGVDAGENPKVPGNGYFYHLTKRGLHRLHAFPNRWSVPQNLTNIGGTVYGLASFGSQRRCGELDRLSASGAEKTVYVFRCRSGGSQPSSPVVSIGGSLYGTASAGGPSGGGTVFAVDASGVEHTLHAFSNTDGSEYDPSGPLVDVGGTLYGTLDYGGPNSSAYAGEVYSITPSGTYANVFTFTDPVNQGSRPGYLVYANGKLYGTTSEGGKYGYGTIFSLTLSGTETVLHNFQKNDDGVSPAGLVFANGKLYGATVNYGPKGHGTIFSLTP